MKKLLQKAGYVSIEVVVVAGVILLAGIIAVSKFVGTGQGATNQANTQIDAALKAANKPIGPE